MIDPIGRKAKDLLLEPILRRLPAGVTPNGITLLSALPGIASAILAAYGLWSWAIVAFALNRILDGLDGLLARERGLQSDFGGYLDIMIDFSIYAIIPIGVWLGAQPATTGGGPVGALVDAPGELLPRALPLLLLLAVFYVNAASWMYLSSILEKRRAAELTVTKSEGDGSRQTSVEMPAGLVEGTETVIFYLLFLLFPTSYPLLFYLMAAATVGGVIQRMVWAWRNVR